MAKTMSAVLCVALMASAWMLHGCGLGKNGEILKNPVNCSKTAPGFYDSNGTGITAELTTIHHGVSGTLEVIDDCTFDVRDFWFDGQGIVVHWWGGQDDVFTADSVGRVNHRNLVSIPFKAFRGTTERFILNQNKNFHMFNSLSVWCETVGVNFGSAVLKG